MKVTAVIAILFALLACSPAWAQQSAEDILEASGVKGGLVVQIGCGDGKLTAALRAGDAFVVQGLDADPTNVEKARAHIQSLGLGGKVSVDAFDGQNLPYVDELVNLVVADTRCEMQDAGSEILRVLAPRGVAVVREKGNEAWLSRIPHPASRISYPASRIPHPASRIPYPASGTVL
jgi:ubiquinone/menaquinone biosynthesis C-methylase UbiE